MRNSKFTAQEERALSRLLNEVKDKSLQTILRKALYSDEDIKTVVSEERPSLTNEDFQKLFK